MTWSDEAPRRAGGTVRLRPILLLLLLVPVLASGPVGCGPGSGADRAPAERVADGDYTVRPGDGSGPEDRSGPRFAAEPRLETVTLDDERRPAIVLPAGAASWSWRVRIPEDGRLQVGVGRIAAASATRTAADAGFEATIALRRGSDREILEVLRPPAASAADPAAVPGWLDAGVDLAAWAGDEVTVELAVHGADPGGEVAWAPVALSTAAPAPELAQSDRPNILLIVVDTLRFDHLPAYGYHRDTAPAIQRLLVEPGLVAEDAYSQAPWTLPSVVSYMTSRFPGEVLSGDPATFGIPEGVPALPEVLSGIGYRTGGFFANPTLRATNGFVRGFGTFYTPSSMSAIQAHADEINRRALPWLQAHRDRPFFLYVHYIDPHDPYMNPDVVDGRSPYFDDPGGINGRWVHGVYTGKIPVDDLDRQIRHFTALYDTEIRYVDRAIGELLETIPPEILEQTLVVLTSDHGEELYDHGGWKHGHTLYEDQIHVPLLVRWDGRVPAGARLDGTVRLVDLAPTLVAAAGGEAPATWQGENLLGPLTGDEPLPRLPAFAQHLNSGPMRVASVLDGKKLVRFNRNEPFEPADELQSHLYAVDMGRLERTEVYDLDADPEERTDLAAASGADPEQGQDRDPDELVSRLDGIVQHQLHPALQGLRAWTDGLPPGGRLTGRLRFERSPDGVFGLFLGSADRIAASGRTVEIDLVGEAAAKGFLVTGDPGALVDAELALDGEPLPAGRLRYGQGSPFTGREIPPGAFETEVYPAPADRAGLRLWRFGGVRPESDRIDPETRRSLEALGYIQ